MFFFNKDENKIFKPRTVEHAYLNIINDDLKTAQAIFESIDSPRALWGKSFTDILIGYLERFPTYFEIRNFLEIDLDFLLKNEKLEYVQQLLGATELLADINQEVYKYIGRVMYENKHYNTAREYLEKSKKHFYNDPELHFLFAKYFFNSYQYDDALFYVNECLRILPDYFPAKTLKKEIEMQLL
jgi:tetratricopeptide (TPR) repeat protein